MINDGGILNPSIMVPRSRSSSSHLPVGLNPLFPEETRLDVPVENDEVLFQRKSDLERAKESHKRSRWDSGDDVIRARRSRCGEANDQNNDNNNPFDGRGGGNPFDGRNQFGPPAGFGSEGGLWPGGKSVGMVENLVEKQMEMDRRGIQPDRKECRDGGEPSREANGDGQE